MAHVWVSEWAIQHTCMSHGTCMNESWHTHEWVMAQHKWVMSHTWRSHDTHINESWHMYEWVTAQHMNESCHTHLVDFLQQCKQTQTIRQLTCHLSWCRCVAGVLQVCCSVLQCVATCCSVLQCVAVWCSVLQCVALCQTSLQLTCHLSCCGCVAIVLQVRCSVLHRVAV